MKNKILLLLLRLAEDKGYEKINNYNQMDDFYAYLGYDLEAESLLHDLGIHGTSDLQDALSKL